MTRSEKLALRVLYDALSEIPLPREGKGPVGMAEYSFDMRKAKPLMLSLLRDLLCGEDAGESAKSLRAWLEGRRAEGWL